LLRKRNIQGHTIAAIKSRGRVLLMHFQAIKADLDPLSFREALEDYVYAEDVGCPACHARYQLWAPILETEQPAVEAQAKWLLGYLASSCQDHADIIRTPDRPE
jgi:hypothetical protein